MIDLGSLVGGSSSRATGINDSRQVCGTSLMHDGTSHGCLFEHGYVWDLGTLGGASSYATAINESGEIVGYSELPSINMHAFITQNRKLKDLGTLPMGNESYAYGVNQAGTVVGSATDSHGNMHAVVYLEGRLQDLNNLIPQKSGWVLTEARSINDNGVIVGEGFKDGIMNAFMMHPL